MVLGVLAKSALDLAEMTGKYRYHTINLPKNLAEKITEVIESGEHGYTSLPEFTKAAVRRYLRELGYLS